MIREISAKYQMLHGRELLHNSSTLHYVRKSDGAIASYTEEYNSEHSLFSHLIRLSATFREYPGASFMGKIQNLFFDLWWRHTLPITYDDTWIWNYTSNANYTSYDLNHVTSSVCGTDTQHFGKISQQTGKVSQGLRLCQTVPVLTVTIVNHIKTEDCLI